MGTRDLTEKVLEAYNDVFADIVNVLLFNGEKKIREEDLIDASVHSQYKTSDDMLHEQERDVSKFWNNCNVKIALLGIENQTKPEKQMPLRIFGYEGASYREQLGNATVYPVVTLILYFGTDKHWSYGKTIKEVVNIPEELDEYVNNVKINVFEVAWLSDSVIEKFTSDFRIVAKFFSEKRKNKNYIPNDKSIIRHVDAILKLLSVMTGDSRYEAILANGHGKGVHNMCDVAERLENKGRIKGRAEGQAEFVFNMLKAGKSAEQIADFCGLDLSYVKEIEKRLSE